MARLFGYFANQSDRLKCALALEGDAVSITHGVRVDGWGVGSYQHGEVLLRRKPSEPVDPLALRDLVRDLRTDCALAHVRTATSGGRSLENTHPFRYRQWLFAHNGSIPGIAQLRPALLQSVPDFLQRNIRGDTDSELLFHLYLGHVYNTGRLDDPEIDRATLTQSLRETLVTLDAVSKDAGAERATVNFIVTHGYAMLAMRRGLPMSWVRRSGIRDCAACRRAPDVSGREPKRFDHETYKFVMIASDHPTAIGDWYEVPDNAVLAVDRTLDAHVTQF